MKRSFYPLSACLLIAASARAAQPLRSPWDLKPVTRHDGTYSCPKITPLPKDINVSDFYSDAKHSVIDPKRKAENEAADRPYRDISADAIDAAEKYRASGNQGAADCVLKILDAEADGDAMTGTMEHNQSYYVQNWTLGALAVTWLKVRDANPGTPEDRARATAWLDKVGRQVQDYFAARHEKGTNDGTNNHFYWAGYAAMSAAIAADDRGLWDWSLTTYHEALSRVLPDGTLPLEMDRGQRALHYHVFALAPLTSMAEFGSANGLDLYNADHGALHRLARRTAAGLINNTYFSTQAKVPQDTPEKNGLKSEDVLWMKPYLAHFPEPNMSKLLNSTNQRPYGYLGGFPPG